jgi:hypothetical protein
MKKFNLKMSLWTFALLLCAYSSKAQVGIGTATPANSSILDLTATDKGFLTPRMTTTERSGILLPVDGLIVYDTTLKFFYHYNAATSSWVRINSEVRGRLNFKRIKSTDNLTTILAEELSAGAGTTYKLNTNTYYEINGTINVDFPIDLNNSYLVGLDANEDKLVRSGNLFVGVNGGTIKNITISVPSGNVFTLSGASTENFIFRDSIIAGCSNVGTISDFGLVFFAVVQYAGNATGITYNNITRLLLSNTAWFGNNSGTFEKFTGSFSAIQKQGGFCEVNGSAIGVDVSGNPTITGDAVMESVVFSGSNSAGFVNRYTSGGYTGYNFNNKWTVTSPGIPLEGDRFAVGDVSFDLGIGFGNPTTLTNGSDVKIAGVTTSNNFFRATNGAVDNRIVYAGNKKRFFTVTSTLSFAGTTSQNTRYIFFIKKNGTTAINQSKTYAFSTNTVDIRSTPIQCVVEMNPGDYIEVFANRFDGDSNILTVSLNLFMR